MTDSSFTSVTGKASLSSGKASLSWLQFQHGRQHKCELMAAKQAQQTQEQPLNSPRDFPTTQSFVTAQEELEPVPSGMEESDADVDEVSSPNWKPIGRNTKRQVIQLHTGQ